MASALAALSALLVGVALLLLGNGLQNTLLGVRAGIEGFPTLATGALMSAYFIGYIGGSLYGPMLVRRVGHVRAFSALTAIASATALAYAVAPDPIGWALMRMLTGACFAGLYLIIESWINSRATNVNRGTVLSVYMTVNLSAQALGQQLLNLADPGGFRLFALVSGLISLAAIPVALTTSVAPTPVATARLDLGRLYRLSPLALIACLGTGLSNAAIITMTPIFGQQIGLSDAAIATLMSATIFGGTLLQWPVGRLSDRFDRRKVIIAVCAAIVLVAGAIAWAGAIPGSSPGTEPALFGLLFLLGGVAFPLYSLSVAHANDFRGGADFVQISGGLLLSYGIGASVGPFAASALMAEFGPAALFYHVAGVSLAIGLFGLWRMRRRPTVPEEARGEFVAVPGTSSVVYALDPRADSAPRTGGEGGAQPISDARSMIAFWFSEDARANWWKADAAFDAKVAAGCARLHAQAAAGALDPWQASAEGALALVLLLDQVPRNLYRGTARAFATDPAARRVTEAALARNFDSALGLEHRLFLYLPFEHSENIADQQRAVEMIERLGNPQWTDFARRHRDIILRFGRFPHRNQALGRASTADETAFLAQPGSSF